MHTHVPWISRAELHRVPFTYLVQKGTSQSLCEGHHPRSGYLYTLLAKRSYGRCSYTCKPGFWVNTANSCQVRHRHIFRQFASKTGTPHTVCRITSLPPRLAQLRQQKSNIFKSVIWSLDKSTGCLAV